MKYSTAVVGGAAETRTEKHDVRVRHRVPCLGVEDTARYPAGALAVGGRARGEYRHKRRRDESA